MGSLNRYFTTFQLWKLKTLFGHAFINVHNFFLETRKLADFEDLACSIQ